MNLQKALEKTLLGSKQGPKRLMDLLNIGSSHFYRILDPENGADLKYKDLVRVMLTTGDFSMLHALAGLCGFVCVKVPRGRKLGAQEVGQLSVIAGRLSAALAAFYDSNGRTPTQAEIKELATENVRQIEGHKRAVVEYKQPSLFD